MVQNVNVLERVAEATGVSVSELQKMPWKKVVDEVILPKMAGPKGTRWCIHDNYMNLVGDFSYELSIQDSYTATAMLEIALQRLSCGAVYHEATPWPEPLPKEYWDYSSCWDEAHIMTEGCYNFIMKGIEQCLKNEVTRDHTLKILFGLMEGLSPNGEKASGYSAFDNEQLDAVVLFAHAQRMAEQYGPYEELYKNYVQPGQWQKHKIWLADNYSKINWNNFFSRTDCLRGGWFAKLRQKREIKKDIRILSMPVAR